MRTPRGVIGFEPGQAVSLVAAGSPTGKFLVTDGLYRVEVASSQLTRDANAAAILRRRDQAQQLAARLARDIVLLAQERARRQHEEALRRITLDQDLYLAGLAKPVVIGAIPLRLDPGFKPTSCMDASYDRHGDPYSAAHGHLDHWEAPVSVGASLNNFVHGPGY